MNYYNTLDVLANRYPRRPAAQRPRPHQVLEADRGADFATITRNHLALLDQNAAIKDRFLSEPDWLNLYGLPIRYEEREVDGNPQRPAAAACPADGVRDLERAGAGGHCRPGEPAERAGQG